VSVQQQLDHIEMHVSQITAYQTCPRMYKYQYVERLAPRLTNPKLFLGKAGHAALAAYYQRQDALQAFDTDVQAQLEQMSPYMDPDSYLEFQEQAVLGRKLVEHYVRWAQENDDFRPIAIEQRFAVPVYAEDGRQVPGVYYIGVFDGIAEDVYGNLWLLEHKFYSSFVSETVLRLDSQAGFYLVAASDLYPDRNVVGVIYTMIRKVDPAKAKSSIIRRHKVFRNVYEQMQLRRRLYHLYQQIYHDSLFIPSPGFHCSWKCPYTELCIAEEDGSDTEALKEMLYTTKDPREPFVAEEE
jgi:hypothetical protein